VRKQAHVDAHASRESALWLGCGYAADKSVEAVLRIYRIIGKNVPLAGMVGQTLKETRDNIFTLRIFKAVVSPGV
jgi:hypothetical protein